MELVTAGAIVGDLDPEERLTYAAHRRWCLDCRRLERDLDGVMVDLSLAAPRREAPPHLLAAVRGESRGEGLAGAFAGPAEADVEPTGDRGPGGDAVPGGDPGRNVAASPAASGVAATGAASRVVAWRRRRPLAASLALVAVLAVVVAGLGARDIAR